MTHRATGTFDVKMTPLPAADSAEGSFLGRYSIDKQFSGDLLGTSYGQMLGAGTAVENSMGYVALERITGTLSGRKGSFVLQHNGTMNRGAMQLIVSVLPDSGTDQLAGIAGTMKIIIEGGKHSYEFDYTLPAAP